MDEFPIPSTNSTNTFSSPPPIAHRTLSSTPNPNPTTTINNNILGIGVSPANPSRLNSHVAKLNSIQFELTKAAARKSYFGASMSRLKVLQENGRGDKNEVEENEVKTTSDEELNSIKFELTKAAERKISSGSIRFKVSKENVATENENEVSEIIKPTITSDAGVDDDGVKQFTETLKRVTINRQPTSIFNPHSSLSQMNKSKVLFLSNKRDKSDAIKPNTTVNHKSNNAKSRLYSSQSHRPLKSQTNSGNNQAIKVSKNYEIRRHVSEKGLMLRQSFEHKHDDSNEDYTQLLNSEAKGVLDGFKVMREERLKVMGNEKVDVSIDEDLRQHDCEVELSRSQSRIDTDDGLNNLNCRTKDGSSLNYDDLDYDRSNSSSKQQKNNVSFNLYDSDDSKFKPPSPPSLKQQSKPPTNNSNKKAQKKSNQTTATTKPPPPPPPPQPITKRIRNKSSNYQNIKDLESEVLRQHLRLVELGLAGNTPW